MNRIPVLLLSLLLGAILLSACDALEVWQRPCAETTGVFVMPDYGDGALGEILPAPTTPSGPAPAPATPSGPPPPGSSEISSELPLPESALHGRNLITVLETSMIFDMPTVMFARQTAEWIAAEAGGYVAEVELTQTAGTPAGAFVMDGVVVLQAPAPAVNLVFERLADSEGYMTAFHVIRTDVTRHYRELEAHLRALESALAERQASIDDERAHCELVDVQRQILTLNQSKAMLDERIGFSEVRIKVYQDVDAIRKQMERKSE